MATQPHVVCKRFITPVALPAQEIDIQHSWQNDPLRSNEPTSWQNDPLRSNEPTSQNQDKLNASTAR